jgi:hypothetical protein
MAIAAVAAAALNTAKLFRTGLSPPICFAVLRGTIDGARVEAIRRPPGQGSANSCSFVLQKIELVLLTSELLSEQVVCTPLHATTVARHRSEIVPERDGNAELTASRSRSRAEGQRGRGAGAGGAALGFWAPLPINSAKPAHPARNRGEYLFPKSG